MFATVTVSVLLKVLPLDEIVMLIQTHTRNKYGDRLVDNSQYRLTVNTPFSRDAVTAIFRIEELVTVYSVSVRHY